MAAILGATTLLALLPRPSSATAGSLPSPRGSADQLPAAGPIEPRGSAEARAPGSAPAVPPGFAAPGAPSAPSAPSAAPPGPGAGCEDPLLAAPQEAPSDPSDLLYYVNRWRPIPAAYPVSDTSPWMPCLGPLPRGAASDLLCLPYAYRYRTPEALRAVAFESPAPAEMPTTHDGLPVGHGGKVGFRALMDAARAAGHDLRVRSGFRPFSSQEIVFRGWMRSELASGLSAEQAHRRASTYSAQPGHSEHQLGTTADLVYRASPGGPFYDGWAPEKIADSAPMRWMQRHAHRFGVVLSYPREDISITQYVWEPWHYRYVGVAAADAMHRCSLSPEAFLNARYRAGPQPAFDLGPARSLADRGP